MASAQPVTGLYLGAGAGVNLMQNEHIEGSGAPQLGSKLGPAIVGSLGWGFGNGLRMEVEGDYRDNKFNTATPAVFGPGTSAGGWEQKYGAMVNVLYDFTGIGPVEPYVGLGGGYQWVNADNVSVSGPFGSAHVADSTKGDFAYQAILGVALPITAAPGLALTAEYRFMGLAGDRSYGTTFTSPGGPTFHGSVKLDDDYNHTFLIGFRYNFGQAPMVAAAAATAAAPAPAVAPARSYLLFFDWDKSNLTDRARQIIKEAADNSTHVQYTRIEVNGYTDTSGTPQYNMGLSIRRASAVKAELIKDGVPVGAIATQGFGETHLLVATGPGVREPQNRRVEIVIH
jgi:outer membrane protein OmpA-like peptidoglycan-associated protein